MTALNESAMREISGTGFWDGFLCGASATFAIGMMFSPDPVSKLAIGMAWGTAIGSCGITLF